VDASSIAILEGDIKDDRDLPSAGLSNFGYASKLNYKDGDFFLPPWKLAGAAGKRGMQTDPAAAFVVARRQDMIRLAVALIEVLPDKLAKIMFRKLLQYNLIKITFRLQ